MRLTFDEVLHGLGTAPVVDDPVRGEGHKPLEKSIGWTETWKLYRYERGGPRESEREEVKDR